MALVSEMLSRLLVAYTMEFDNEVERRLPHRTSRGPAAGRTGVPWLISQPTWANFLDLLDEPAPLQALPAKLVNLGGLQRWGYVTVGRGTGAIVTLTAAGVAANRVFREVSDLMDARWAERFGAGLADDSPGVDSKLPRHLPLSAVSRPATSALPRFTTPHMHDPATPRSSLAGNHRSPLSTLLAQELIRLTAAVGGRTPVPMGLGSNVLRVLATGACRTRDLPGRAGVSREAVDGSVKALLRGEAASVAGRVAELTDHGQSMWAAYSAALAEVDEQWRESRPGLRAALESALGRHDALVEAITPGSEGWRAYPPYAVLTRTMLENPAANLPAYPMVSHRGGFPDGS